MPSVVQERMADRADRCDEGFHLAKQHPHLCVCGAGGQTEWQIFRDALRRARRADGTVHANDVRPIIAGRIFHKHIASFYRRAKSDRLISDTGEKEPSTDGRGRNTDKDARIYRWEAAA